MSKILVQFSKFLLTMKALMQDSTEEDEESILDDGVNEMLNETDKSVLDTGNVSEEKAMVHNTDTSSDIQPKMSETEKLSQTPAESSNEDVADHNNENIAMH